MRSRTEVEASSRVMPRRMPSDMPVGLLLTLLWLFASSSGSPGSNYSRLVFVEEGRRAARRVV